LCSFIKNSLVLQLTELVTMPAPEAPAPEPAAEAPAPEPAPEPPAPEGALRYAAEGAVVCLSLSFNFLYDRVHFSLISSAQLGKRRTNEEMKL
jgi:hypothetical protein